MPILVSEEILALSAASREIPGRPHPSTLFRWATGTGCNGHKLEVIRVGRRLFTSREAIARFLAACNDGRPVVAPDLKVATKRRKEIAAAVRRVRAAGV